jgi:hypothetical protein
VSIATHLSAVSHRGSATWKKLYTGRNPTIRFHEVLRFDGTYREAEVESEGMLPAELTSLQGSRGVLSRGRLPDGCVP